MFFAYLERKINAVGSLNGGEIGLPAAEAGGLVIGKLEVMIYEGSRLGVFGKHFLKEGLRTRGPRGG